MHSVVWLLLASSLATSACASLPASAPALASNIPTNEFLVSLKVDGPRLVSADGRTVALHGVNIGGWLVPEAWMCGFDDSKDNEATSGPGGLVGRSALEDLEQRFGSDRAAKLMRAWQDHWITTADLDEVRSGGFNLIRVPISYRTLQHADGSWIRDARGEIDFSRMDWIVKEAAKRGIYTIFDLHVWPDQRFAYDKIGRPEGEKIRTAMANFWSTVAVHYRGDGAIAAFDLINEFPGNWGVQQVLSEAVQKADPNRVQVIEGFTFPEYQKLRQAGAFPNSIFSDHIYGQKPLTTAEFKARLEAELDANEPIYIGEFLAENFDETTKLMNAQGIAWSSWTYKTVDMGDWGIFNYYPSVRTDIENDSYDEILNRWTTNLTAWQKLGASQTRYVEQERRLAADQAKALI